jgi:hypothetical protein
VQFVFSLCAVYVAVAMVMRFRDLEAIFDDYESYHWKDHKIFR